MTQWPPAYMQGLGSANYGMWDSPTPGLTLSGQVQPGEGGVDIGVPIGTPVYALASGPIIAAGYWNDAAHGVITQRVNVPGAGVQDLYYQHIQLDPSIAHCMGNCNQYVQKGQKIGVIGPFNEIEMGFNSLWGGVWGTGHPGPWIRDPRPWLSALVHGSPAPVSASGQTTPGTPGAPGIPNPLAALASVNSFFQSLSPALAWLSSPIRIIKMVTGLVLIGVALYLLTVPEAAQKAAKFFDNQEALKA